MAPKKLPVEKLYLYSSRDSTPLSREDEDRLRQLEAQYLSSYESEQAKLESKLEAINEAMNTEEDSGEEDEGKGKAQETLLRRIFGGVLGQMEEGEEREVRHEGGFEIEDEEFEDLGDVAQARESEPRAQTTETPSSSHDLPEAHTPEDPGEGSSGFANQAAAEAEEASEESGDNESDDDEYVRQQRENRRLLAERQAREAERTEGEAEATTQKQKIVGKKKGKSLARKEQKKAYHEYTRMVSDARKREEQEWQEEYKEVLALQKWSRVQNEARASFEIMTERLYDSFLAELEVQSRQIWQLHQQQQLEVSHGGYLFLGEDGGDVVEGGENVVTSDGRFWVTLTPHERQVVAEFIRDKGRVELEEVAEVVRELKRQE